MYEKPLLYDIAFGYRDFRQEVGLLLGWAARVSGRPPASALELAAGPADHAIEMAARGLKAAAIDLAPSMCEYARGKTARRGVAVEVHCADMIDFALHRRFDLAATMISSLGHVYTVDALVRHLRCVAAHLAHRGVYVIELPHPGDFLGKARKCTHWTEARDGVEVEVRWGRPDDPYDAIAQITDATVEIRARRGSAGSAERHEDRSEDRVRLKDWTASELDAAIALAGVFEVVERHGDFALDAPFDDSPGSWRMISVLRVRG